MKSTGKMTKTLLTAGLILLVVFSTRAVLASEDCNDTTPPTLVVHCPKNGDIVGWWGGTDELCVTVNDYNPCPEGSVVVNLYTPGWDRSLIKTLRWYLPCNGGCYGCRGSWTCGSYPDIPDGPTTITVVASDNSFNTTKKTITVTVDNTFPTLEVEGMPQNGAIVSGTISFTATASDEYGIKKLTSWVATDWGGESQTVSASTVTWDTTTLSEGGFILTVNAFDNAGNWTQQVVDIYFDNTAPTVPTGCQGWSDFSSTTSITSGGTYCYPSPYFEWYGATDPEGSGIWRYYSGIEGYYVYYGTEPDADPATQGTFQSACTYEVSEDAMTLGNTYYLCVKTRDYAGNTSDVYNAFTYTYCPCSCEVLEIGKTYGKDIPSTGIIRRNSPDFFKLLIYFDHPDIFFQDIEGTGDDHWMQYGTMKALEALVGLVNREWNREVQLLITDAWDEDSIHEPNSAHHEGRALDLVIWNPTTKSVDVSKYPCLGCLAFNAGFDFVYNEGTHIHVTEYGQHVSPPGGMDISTDSPVDLMVIDPDGLTITKELNEIPGAIYTETDIDGDGQLEDRITIVQRKIGNYLINVIPEPNALPTDTYSLEVIIDGQTMVLAEDVQIQDIPAEPYEFESTLNLPSSIEICVGWYYDDPCNPNDLTYEFELEVQTDEWVELVEFLTPAGNTFQIPKEPGNCSDGICTWYGYEDGAYCWEYWAEFSDPAGLADYGDGTYTITVHYQNDSNDQTTVWFGIPDTNDPIAQPIQEPVLTFPTYNGSTTSPVRFTWQPCTDANATSICLGLEKEDADEEYVDIELPVNATSSDPITLSEGTWEAWLCFENSYDFNNVDGIAVEIGKYSESDSPFTVTNPADLNRNGIVNFADFAIFALAWVTEPGDAGWNPACDISDPNDNFIDMLDLDVLTENWLAGVE